MIKEHIPRNPACKINIPIRNLWHSRSMTPGAIALSLIALAIIFINCTTQLGQARVYRVMAIVLFQITGPIINLLLL
jgi:hypothetical protein